MEDTVLRAGDIAKAVSAILALLAVILWRPIKAAYKRHKDEQKAGAEFRKIMIARLDSIDNNISALIDDMGDMQYESLAQAHDFYTGQGWCPSSTKKQLCQMHKSYSAKGRNHLGDRYEEEILALREHP